MAKSCATGCGEAAPGRRPATPRPARRTAAPARPAAHGPYHLQVALHAGGRGGAITIADRRIGPKTGESPTLLPLLHDLASRIDVRGMVITLDAGLSGRANLTGIRNLGMHYLILCKENHGRLYRDLCRIPFETATLHQRATSIDGGARRREHRTITVLPAPPAITRHRPDATQVILLDRTRETTTGQPLPNRWTASVGITSVPATQWGPAEPLAANRSHWQIETQHWIRDTGFGEDTSGIWKGSRPDLMVTLRQLVHGTIRLAGLTTITEARRHAKTNINLLLSLLGQPKP